MKQIPLWARVLVGVFIALQVAGLIYGCLTYDGSQVDQEIIDFDIP